MIKLQWLLARVLRMSGVVEDKDMEHDDSIASSVASPVAYPVAYPVASPMTSPSATPRDFQVSFPNESQAGFQPNSLPHQVFFASLDNHRTRVRVTLLLGFRR